MKTDKILHFLAGYAIVMTIGLWLPICGPTVGIIAGVVAGAAKELIYDKAMRRGTPDWWDFIYTGAGSVAAFAMAFIHAKLT